MPELSIPDLAKGECTRILASAQIPLTGEAHRALLKRMGTDDKGIHVSTRRSKKAGKLVVVLEERFGIDPLTDKASRANAEAFFKTEKKKLAAAMHLDVDAVLTVAGTSPPDQTDDRASVTGFWEWVRDRGGLNAKVHAWGAYSTENFEPVIELPLPVPTDVGAFTGIAGLWLVKKDSEAPQRTLYEVMLRSQEERRLSALAVFRTELDGNEAMLKTILARAMQIMDFAVHPRAKRGGEKE